MTAQSQDDLTGTVSIVVGASRGIGAATAHALAARGAAVVLTARSIAAAETAAQTVRRNGGRAAAFACDVADYAAVEALVAEIRRTHGRIDHVVNNAGVIDPVARLADVAPDQWAKLIAINLGGVFNMCRAILPIFRGEQRGVIVNLSSGGAHRPVEGWSAYCASKAAALMLTRSLALEEAGSGIRVYGFQPGAVDTGMLAQVRAANLSEYSARSQDTLLPPELPAQAIAWICAAQPEEWSGRELSVRDPEFRARAGLPERDYS